MLKTSKRKSMQSKWQRIRKSCRRRRFCKHCKSCKIRKNQRRSSHMCKKQLKSQMQMQIIKKFSTKSQEISYCKRKLIVNFKNENWTLKTMKMRDLINNALKKTKIDLIVVMIVKTQKKNNIVLMILKKYTADVLIAQRVTWKHVFDVKSIKKDEKWHKIVIHSLKIEIFNMKTEMKNLKTELESYNLELKLIINSIWLLKSENRSWNKYASIILAFRIKAEVQRHLKKRLLAVRLTY